MKLISCFLLSLVITANIFSSQFKIEGKVYNKATGESLSFANIRVAGSMLGASANGEGTYQLNLNPGKFKLIASCIGFRSDTIYVKVEKNSEGFNFYLTPVEIQMHDITVVAGVNPAIRIVKEAIKRKNERKDKLKSFEYEAYTKGVIKTSGDLDDVNSKSITVGVDVQKVDSLKLSIKGIMENHSKGYFKKPDKYKEFITAQKQTLNFPPSVNTLTGGRVVQNFYDDDLKFFSLPMVGPISNGALDYYYYSLRDTLAMDNYKIFKIYCEPDHESDPGFTGYIYIKDSTYDLIKIDVDLNRAANIGGLFEKVNIFQQFLPYKDDIYMPIDYRMFLRANLLGIFRIGFEMNSVMYNYEINNDISDELFDKAILTVENGADKKDSAYWNNSITIPNTNEEIKAYKKIDSITAIPKTFWKRVTAGLLANRMELSDNFFVSSPLSMYHFNRVEGHTLGYGLFFDNYFDKRFNSNLQAQYGFSDKKFKAEAGASYLFGNYRTWGISVNGFNKLETLFPESDKYDEFTSTVLALLTKYEFRNYYYTKGFSAGIKGDVFPILNLGLEFTNRTDNSAVNNSDYSFFAKNKKYSINPPIYETRLNIISTSFNIDFRDYIEDGYFRSRNSLGGSYIVIGGGIDYSDRKNLKSSLYFTRYNLGIYGELYTFNWASLSYKIYGTYSDGTLPYQMFYALPGNIDLVTETQTFRTVRVAENFGDRSINLFLDHDFGSELFKRIPVINKMDLQLSAFFNAGWTDISAKAKSTIPAGIDYEIFRTPLYEAGFSIGHILFPFRFEFTWRLNHTEKNNFVFGLNTPIL